MGYVCKMLLMFNILYLSKLILAKINFTDKKNFDFLRGFDLIYFIYSFFTVD